jgi:tetratricopeptide (TPR) repeat protein
MAVEPEMDIRMTPAEAALARARRKRAQRVQRGYCPIMEVRQRLSDDTRELVVGLLLEENPEDSKDAEEILKADPATDDDPDALDLLGVALRSQGNFGAAKDVTQRSLLLKKSRSLAQLAAIHFDLGEVDQATAVAEEAVNNNGRIPQAWINFLHGLAKQGNTIRLEQMWHRLAAEFPTWRSNATFVDQLKRDVVMVLGPENKLAQRIILEIEE